MGLILDQVLDTSLNGASSCEALEGASRGAYIVAISAEAGEYGLPRSDSSLMSFPSALAILRVYAINERVQWIIATAAPLVAARLAIIIFVCINTGLTSSLADSLRSPS